MIQTRTKTKPTLRDVLREIADKHSGDDATLKEWYDAVARLLDQLQAWLKVVDPEGIIQATRTEIEVSEPGFGRYPICSLTLRAYNLSFKVLPIARRTASTFVDDQQADVPTFGRVDLHDGASQFVLHRIKDGGEDRWYMMPAIPSVQKQPELLTCASFEAALVSYFR